MNRDDFVRRWEFQYHDVWYKLLIEPEMMRERGINNAFNGCMESFVKEFNKGFEGLNPLRYSCREDTSMLIAYPRYIYKLESRRWKISSDNRTELFCDFIKGYCQYKKVIDVLYDSFKDYKEHFNYMLEKGEDIFLSQYTMKELIE